MQTLTSRHATFCAAGLVIGSCLLAAIGGEADGDHILPWLSTLALLTVIWLLSLGAKTVTPALLLGTALAIRLIFLSMPTGYDTYRYVWEGRTLVE